MDGVDEDEEPILWEDTMLEQDDEHDHIDTDNDDNENDHLVGLGFLECGEMPSFPKITLDLDFLQQDPPKADTNRNNQSQPQQQHWSGFAF
jgi:hypothetical protein